MYEVQKEVAQLEILRQRARLSYGIYAAGLLVAVIMAFCSNIVWAVIVGVLIILLYLIFCQRDIKAYRNRYRRVKLLNETQGLLKQVEIIDSGIFSTAQLVRDGVLPGIIEKGVVRIGLRGYADKGIAAEMADIAVMLPAELQGKKQNQMLTGCYMRFQLNKESKLHGACFPKAISIGESLKRHYEERGFNPYFWNDFCFYIAPNGLALSERMKELLTGLNASSNGEEIIFFDKDKILVMLKGRYLNVGEPDYKRPVTLEKVRQRYLPELSDIVNLVYEGQN